MSNSTQNKVFNDLPEKDLIRSAQIPQLQKKHGFDLSAYKLSNKRQILRNCVDAEVGQYILQNIK